VSRTTSQPKSAVYVIKQGRRHVCPLSREGKFRALESYAGPKPESIGVKEEIEQRRRRKPLKRSGGKLAERIREVVTGGGG
jgi:hypothetical protein